MKNVNVNVYVCVCAFTLPFNGTYRAHCFAFIYSAEQFVVLHTSFKLKSGNLYLINQLEIL